MENRFSNVFLACCASWFKTKIFREQILVPTPQRRIGGISGYFWKLWRTIRGRESCKQCNVWRRTMSIRADLSTGRITSKTWRRRRKKNFTRTCTYREYGLVCLKEMYFYDERRRVLSLPGAGRSEWEVRFFRIVFKLFFVQKLNYLELYGKLTFPAFLF